MNTASSGEMPSSKRHSGEEAFRKAWDRNHGHKLRIQNTERSRREWFSPGIRIFKSLNENPAAHHTINRRNSRCHMSSESMHGTVPSPLLTVDDLAALLKVSPRTIWRMRSCCQLPKPVKVGGGVRWRQSDIESWIAQGCPMPSARKSD